MAKKVEGSIVTWERLVQVAGLLGVIHETLIWEGAVRKEFLLLFAAMMGLDLVRKADAKRRNGST
jgi:hypothetical protein